MSHRVCVVSGANRGIGLAITRQLADHGDTVVLGARDPVKGRAVAEEPAGDGLDVVAEPLDVTRLGLPRRSATPPVPGRI